jgi:hypothetical protein
VRAGGQRPQNAPIARENAAMRRFARYQSGEIRSRLAETVEIARRILHVTGKHGEKPQVRAGCAME